MVHESHLVREFLCEDWGCWYCIKCGCISYSSLRFLAQPCRQHLSRAGRENLGRLRRGLMPGSSKRALAYNTGKASFRAKPRAPTRARGAAVSETLAHCLPLQAPSDELEVEAPAVVQAPEGAARSNFPRMSWDVLVQELLPRPSG